MQRFTQQIEFILEIDKLKSVMRRCILINGSRLENSAEHSWHFALMAMTLVEHCPDHKNINLFKVVKMALIHDIAEIYAGDTYCYDEKAAIGQSQREEIAIKKLFFLLPEDQREEFFSLWLEFEQKETLESRFANAIDRLNPFMLNYYSGGDSWKKHGVTKSQALRRMQDVKQISPALWSYIESLLYSAIEKGYIIDDLKKQ